MRHLLPLLLLSACAIDTSSGNDDLTSVDGIEHTIDFDSFVDVPAGATDDAVKAAIHMQLKSALGALREQGIGIEDRDAQDNIAGTPIVRTTLDVVDASGGLVRKIDRVRYHYHDTALVERDQLPTGPVDLTMLYGDYVSRAAQLIPICSDDQTTDADSLCYHDQPGLSGCRTAITAETSSVNSTTASLADTSKQVSQADADRRFVSTRATLVRTAAAPTEYPEYDQLWGFAGNTSRTKLVVYSFFGVDADEANPYDNGLVEYLRFERAMRKAFPQLQVTYTDPNAWLLDFYVDGQRLQGITWDDVERWIVDRTGLPAAVQGNAQKTNDLLGQVIANFSERWIVWSMPVTVTQHGVTRTMTVEMHTWHGYEDGSDDVRLHARWRYLEAFWNADVFAYTGHSHFGHGPLEPWEYGSGNFPDRYQVMLFNSCLSFNYYDEDFLRMHPEGSAKLDVVVNGLPAYWLGMGQATAGYLIGLLDQKWHSYRDILSGMAVDLPWQKGYDPMRAVNGELDNSWHP